MQSPPGSAIAGVQNLQSVLSECLIDPSLKLQVNQSGSQISVVINRPAAQSGIDYAAVAEPLVEKLRSLNLPNVAAVKVYGRPDNTKNIEWQAAHTLATPSSQASQPTVTSKPGVVTTVSASPKPKSRFREYLEQFSHYSNVISAAALVGLLLLLGFNTLAGQKPQPVVWEYRIESVSDLIFTETMNQLGSEGWELTFARRAQDSTTESFSYECIFKRIKR